MFLFPFKILSPLPKGWPLVTSFGGRSVTDDGLRSPRCWVKKLPPSNDQGKYCSPFRSYKRAGIRLRLVCLLLLLYLPRLLYNRLRARLEDQGVVADSSNLFLSSGLHYCSGLKNTLLLVDVYDAKTDVKLGGIIKPLGEIEEPNYNMTWKLKIPPRRDHGVRFEGDYESFFHELHDRLRIHGTLFSSNLNRAKTIFGGRLEGMQWYGKLISSNGTSFFRVKNNEWNNQANKTIACRCAVNTVAKTDGIHKKIDTYMCT